jgi:predicted RNA-binding Zn-ribbon protein involved in translation (DUF1610 family)
MIRFRFLKSENTTVINVCFIVFFMTTMTGILLMLALPELAEQVLYVFATVTSLVVVVLLREVLNIEWSTGEPIKVSLILKALYHQGPFKRAFRNFFITGNAWGLFSEYAHVNKAGKPKVGRSSEAKARKMANEMQAKHGYYYSVYFCPRCGKWHIGKNRDSISKHLIEEK